MPFGLVPDGIEKSVCMKTMDDWSVSLKGQTKISMKMIKTSFGLYVLVLLVKDKS